ESRGRRGAQGPRAEPRTPLPGVASPSSPSSPKFVMGPGGISRFPPIGLPIATTERYVPAGFILPFREPSQAYQESFPRVGDEQEIEEGHPKEARRFHTPHLQNRAEFGKAIEEQFVSECFMAHGFHGCQERFHFRLRHRPTSIFLRQGNPRISQR